MDQALKQASFLARYAILRARIAAVRGEPIVVASTHRTASTAVYRALRDAAGARVVKCHRLHEPLMSWRRPDPPIAANGLLRNRMTGDWAVLHGITQPRRPARFVMLVRDPIAVAASMAAFDPPPVGAVGCWPLVDPHARAMKDWFDGDVTPALGWAPWDQPFDTDRKAATWVHGPWTILVMRADLDDDAKARELTEFICRPVTMVRINSAEQRGAGREHALVRERIRALGDDVDLIHRSRFCRHFFTLAELAQQRARWVGSTTPP